MHLKLKKKHSFSLVLSYANYCMRKFNYFPKIVFKSLGSKIKSDEVCFKLFYHHLTDYRYFWNPLSPIVLIKGHTLTP